MVWYEIFPQILNMSLTASLVILIVVLCRLLLRRVPKIYSYILWSVSSHLISTGLCAWYLRYACSRAEG